MAKELILNADLYPNAVTERTDDYTAKPRISGTTRNADIADRIVLKRSEYRKETILNILTLADQEKVDAIAEGNSVVDGVGQYLVNISGPFIGEAAMFNPEVNKLGITYTIGKVLRDTLNTVKVKTGSAKIGPVINKITDSTTGEVNQQLTSGSAAVIDGDNIKIAGDESVVGVFFTQSGKSPLKAPLVVHNNPSQLTVLMPVLADGEYSLSITTQFGHGSKLIKEPRTYTFPTLLYVGDKPGGGGDDENPDIL